jgi:hypothetical protein
MVGQAPVIAGLICLIFENISPSVPFLLAVSAIWFGTNNAAREIVREAPIYKRERMFNQGILAYMLSKITVLGTFAAIQSLLFTLIISLRYSNTVPAWADPVNAFLWMLLVSLAASMMGLFLSAVVSTSEKVMTLVPYFLIPQIMLAGAFAKITNPIVEILSYFTLSRWGNEGFCHTQKDVLVEVPDFSSPTQSDQLQDQAELTKEIASKSETANSVNNLKEFFHDSYETSFGDWAFTMSLDVVAVGSLFLLFFVGVYVALKQKDSIKIK